MPEKEPAARPDRFVFLYALAWAGGAIAYAPLLTILLPGRVAELAGPDLGVSWLARLALVGALAASFGNIVFGYLSDRTGTRRPWVLLGLVLSCLMLPRFAAAQSLGALVVTIVAWQFALNLMLGPLSAWAGDRVPDNQKGLLGGLIAIAPGAGALAAALVTQSPSLGLPERLIVVALLVAACILPLLLLAGPAAPITVSGASELPDSPAPQRRRVVAQMWGARFAVQIAEATLFAYLLFWLRSLDPGIADRSAARLFSLVMVLSIPVALLAGRWSDRAGRPLQALAVAAFVSALGLAAMALAAAPLPAMAAFALFGLASAVFLALHTSQTLRILPRADRRGRDLGLFNLTNTVPSLVMPWLVVALVPHYGFQGVFAILSGLAFAAAAFLASISRI